MTATPTAVPATPKPCGAQAKSKRVAPFKMILADPPARTDEYARDYPNLGLLQLISYTRKHTALTDHDIIFLDQFHTIEDHICAAEEHRPRIYGISFTFVTQRVAYETINTLKQRFPDMLIIAGGPHPTAAPQEVLDKTLTDLVCIGEGELVLRAVVDEMVQGQGDFRKIPGLLLRTPSGPVNTGKPRVIENLDSLPLMAWNRIDFNKFIGSHYCKANPQAGIVIMRGCPYRCTFCSSPVWRAAKPWVRLRSPEKIAEEVDSLYNLGVREIMIASDEINVALPWAKEVCRAIADLGHQDLYFVSNLRADKFDDELATLFERMNMWLVHLGVESANNRVLRGIKKRITVEQAERRLDLLKRHKIRALLFMMAFQIWEEGGELKWELPKEVRNSLLWVWKQFLRRRISYMAWAIATPMPGAPLDDIMKRHGFKYADQVLDDWQYHKALIGVDLTSLEISNRARMFYLRAGILSKAIFMILSGRFAWRRNLYRIRNLFKSFAGGWRPKQPAG